ncbi:MAG: hypothetical protein B7C24_12010 [Bacteroidetes bacterium 4572_77]|nr:MAG: hypothetical protein B7C24_12010 [Bacteroidetes bacterium 4572_77]
MRIQGILIFMLLLSGSLGWAQEKESKKYFVNGKPIARIFGNFHTGINEGANPMAFELRRVYLGYQFDLGDHFSTKIQLDIGSPNDVVDDELKKRFAYFKNAYLQYKKGKIKVQFGIISTAQFKAQEQIWGHRYIQKTVIDLNKMGSSADLGMAVYYKATDYLSFDLGLLNGESYGSIQNDSALKLAFGTTIKPIKGLQLRFYGDVVQKTETQINWVNFISYNWNNKFLVGFEYDLQYNYKNRKNNNLYVWSAYVSYNFLEKWQIFGRYDHTESNILEQELDPWRWNKDGEAIITGIQYQLNKHIKFALDYQAWFYTNTDISSKQFLFFNTEIKL